MSSNKRVGILAMASLLLMSLLGAAHAGAEDGWVTAGSLGHPLGYPAVVVLADGRVLAAGGTDYDYGLGTTSAKLYDPASGAWTPTGSMPHVHRHAGAALLSDGSVLVAGGWSQTASYQQEADIFKPALGQWQATQPMLHYRGQPSAVRLLDGRVFVVGDASALEGGYPAEIYDPATQTWSLTSPPSAPRFQETATLLQDGRVLVSGGSSVGGPVGAEVYDPNTDTWTPTGPPVSERWDHTATRLPDGRVLIIGGSLANGSLGASAEIYDPATNAWTAAGNLAIARYSHAAVALADGRVMVIGGNPGAALNSVEVLDPATGLASAGPPLLAARFAHRAVRLQTGAILVVGGNVAACEKLTDASPDETPPVVELTAPLAGATVSGTVLVAADASDDAGVASVDFYDGESLIGSDTTAPYGVPWDTSKVAGSSHVLKARAFDTLNNFADSAGVVVMVQDLTPPQVAVTAPADGATVSGIVTITAAASDASGISRVDFVVDTYPIGSATTTPYSLSWDTSGWPLGSRVLEARAIDLFGNEASSAYVVVTVAEPNTQTAYDSQLRAPRCAPGVAVCDSGDLLVGRGTVGPEPNQPNTLGGSCNDGTAGSFHVDASLDRLRVSTLDGTPLATGKTVKVEATVWASSGYLDTLDLFYAADATAPQWVHIGQIAPQSAVQQTLFTTYVLPEGPLQAIRGRFSHNSISADPCVPDGFSDHDDLVFSVTQREQATYDSALRAPKCSRIGPSCGSGALLVGRGPLGPEPNGPNTTQGECADGTSGTFHVASSIDAITVATLDGTPMSAGQTVRVEATVWPGSDSDRLDLFYSSATSWPSWTYIGSLTPVGPGRQVLSTDYILPEGHAHVVRAVLRSWAWDQPAESCGRGPEDDSDDLWFVSDSGEAKQRLRIDMTSELGGSGTVAVVSGGVAYSCSDPAGCDLDIWAGEAAALTATPASDSAFVDWLGDCSGTGPCTVLMDQMHWIGARFSGPSQLLVRANGLDGGRGRITLAPAPLGGVAPYCDVRPETCIFTYPPNTTVQIVAQAEPGSKFLGWSGGGCVGLGPCVVTVPGAGYISAEFLGPRPLAVTISSVDGGGGSVTATPALGGPVARCVNPGGPDPFTCVYLYPPDTMVTLSSQAQAGSKFLGWSAACSGTGACQVLLGSDPVSVEAAYQGPQFLNLTLTSQGGWGAVALSPASADGVSSCVLPAGVAEQTCSLRYAPESSVSLTAQPAAGSVFAQWDGSCSGSGACQVSAGSDVSAVFKVGTASPQAAYDTQLRAPKCAAGATVCDSGTLLVGRATLGPESHAPNTVGTSCSDGTGGTFHSDESVDRIKVATLDGSPLAPGKTVQVAVTIWAWAGYTSDRVEIYATGNANAPQWRTVGAFIPTKPGLQVLSTTYLLPAGPQQAVRARIRYGGSATSACVPGPYTDHDDLVF
jgi:hypothetical protein